MAKKNMLVNLDLNQNQLLNVLLQKLTQAPTGAKEAQLWYDTSKHLVYFFNGTEAIPVGYLPPATADTLGGVKIGLNVNVTKDGTISINDASNLITGVIRIATDNEAATGSAEDIAINPKQLATEITKALSAALVYKGVWTINGSSTTTYPASQMLPAKKGDMYFVNGNGPATVDGVEWNPGDYLVFNQNVSSGTTITSAMVDKIDSTESSDIVRLNSTQTLTNKTLNADNNTITNLETDNFKTGVIVTEIGATGTDTSLPTEQAVREALTALDNKTQDKVTTAVENNIATWDAAGNTKDSGKKFVTSVALTSASNNNVPTEAAVRTAINEAEGATKFIATNPALTPTDNVCTWEISNPIGKSIDLANAIVSIKETSNGNEVMCDVTYTTAKIIVKINKDTVGDIAASTYTAVVLS